MLRPALLAAAALAVPLVDPPGQVAGSPDAPGTLSAEVVVDLDAPVADVWAAFTTDEGLRSWMAPLADVDLAIGGALRSSYVPGATLGDPSTTVITILAYDPERMLALQTTTFPEGSPFAEVGRGTWAVFYFEPLPSGGTRVTNVGLGYRDDEQSRRMLGFFEQANVMLLERLGEVLVAQREAAEAAGEGGDGGDR